MTYPAANIDSIVPSVSECQTYFTIASKQELEQFIHQNSFEYTTDGQNILGRIYPQKSEKAGNTFTYDHV